MLLLSHSHIFSAFLFLFLLSWIVDDMLLRSLSCIWCFTKSLSDLLTCGHFLFSLNFVQVHADASQEFLLYMYIMFSCSTVVVIFCL